MVDFLRRYFLYIVNTVASFAHKLSKDDLLKIETGLDEAEKMISAEIAFAVEQKLSLLDLLRGKSARQRAIELFSRLNVWDTAGNNGVLIYLLLAEKNIEIIVDRGIATVLTQEEIESVCREIEKSIKAQDICEGVLAGIKKLTALLAPQFPLQLGAGGEVSNKPFSKFP